MYDEDLAVRVRDELRAADDVREKRMFGGLAFLVGGHLAVAASGQGGLLVRVDPALAPELRTEPGVRPMEMRGRPLDGWLRVDEGVVAHDDELRHWVATGVDYARGLPART